MPIKGYRGSWVGVHRTGVAVIAAAIRARERRIVQRLRPGLWAKLLEGWGAVWRAGGPRVRARGGAGPRDSEVAAPRRGAEAGAHAVGARPRLWAARGEAAGRLERREEKEAGWATGLGWAAGLV